MLHAARIFLELLEAPMVSPAIKRNCLVLFAGFIWYHLQIKQNLELSMHPLRIRGYLICVKLCVCVKSLCAYCKAFHTTM